MAKHNAIIQTQTRIFAFLHIQTNTRRKVHGPITQTQKPSTINVNDTNTHIERDEPALDRPVVARVGRRLQHGLHNVERTGRLGVSLGNPVDILHTLRDNGSDDAGATARRAASKHFFCMFGEIDT
jgi:hypothetical protein